MFGANDLEFLSVFLLQREELEEAWIKIFCDLSPACECFCFGALGLTAWESRLVSFLYLLLVTRDLECIGIFRI